MPLILLSNKGSKLTVEEMDGNFEYVKNLTEITYNELTKLISSFGLIPGMFYQITDFRTCYILPDYNIYKNSLKTKEVIHCKSDIEPIVVLATSDRTLSLEAWQPKYPRDRVKYDWAYSVNYDGSPAFGKITERIDEFGNRTDYDHRTIKFKRYRNYIFTQENLQSGKIKILSDGSIIGNEETRFSEFSPGDIIAVPGTNEKFFKIVSVEDDRNMKITGKIILSKQNELNFYSVQLGQYDKYYPNNVDFKEDFKMYLTFPDLKDGQVRNNYIGDHAINFHKSFTGDFSLSNNVFKGKVCDNYFGNSFYNNTIQNCSGNKIGEFGFNNIIENFNNNNIGSNFSNNFILSTFCDNTIFKNFEKNKIFNKFSNNRIGLGFSKNSIELNFDMNSIMDNFSKNKIIGSFYNNYIHNNFSDNIIYPEFWGNRIGDDFNNNNIYLSSFYDNNIGRFFMSNILGDILNVLNGEFYYNSSQNNFKSNTIDGSIRENYFNNEFTNNIIICDLVNNQFQTFVDGVDMNSLDHIGDEYNCRIFKATDGDLYIEYFDRSKMVYDLFSKQQYTEEHLNYDDPYLCKVE